VRFYAITCVSSQALLFFCRLLVAGYEYCFPFLSEEWAVVEERGVRPLYHHLFHVEQPTLAFVGLPHSVVRAVSGTQEHPRAPKSTQAHIHTLP
jgi:hypothetical protein